MPGFTPGRRWQPAYSPFQKETFDGRALQVLEYSIKGPLFGCRMCGNCLLQETARICPMECPKGLRNGPCGGSTSERCYGRGAGHLSPQGIIQRMEEADKSGKAQEEGVQIALEIINRIKTYRHQGIHGIHLMPIGWDEIVPRIVTEAGLMPEKNVAHEKIPESVLVH